MKVLLVDDHNLFLDGLELIFQRANVHTTLALSLDAAIDQLTECADIDLALVDLDIAGSNGLELVSLIQEKGWLIPVSSKELMAIFLRPLLAKKYS